MLLWNWSNCCVDSRNMKLYKYHGAGNDFLLADNRDGRIRLNPEQIRRVCDRHLGIGSDGLMLLDSSNALDFRMQFFNPDGSSGMMCGNGGRCIAAFAARMGVEPREGRFEFEAPDGPHTAVFLGGDAGSRVRTVRLKMRDVSGITRYDDESAYFLDTGTRHLVKFVTGLSDYPVLSEGRRLRWDPRFAPVGINVNFVETRDRIQRIRTIENGDEDEPLACGTGIVAAAMAACYRDIPGTSGSGGSISYTVQAAVSDLQVDFTPSAEGEPFRATEVWLTGPATFVAGVEIML